MYWILSRELVDEDNDADISGNIDFELGGDISFRRGESVPIPIPKILLTMSDNCHIGRLTDHLSITETTGLVFSSKFRELLKILRVENIQYFDFEMLNPEDGSRYTDYKIANIVGHVDCVDKERSDLKYWENGNIKRVRKLVLDESRIPPELKIFRLSSRRILTVVHESIRNAIISAGITGCVFYKPENYR